LGGDSPSGFGALSVTGSRINLYGRTINTNGGQDYMSAVYLDPALHPDLTTTPSDGGTSPSIYGGQH